MIYCKYVIYLFCVDLFYRISSLVDQYLQDTKSNDNLNKYPLYLFISSNSSYYICSNDFSDIKLRLFQFLDIVTRKPSRLKISIEFGEYFSQI